MSEDATNSTLLTYAVISDPDPLQVSSTAKLIIIVSNDTSDYVNVESIVFELPVGTYAKDLTSDPSSIQSTVPDGWGISQEAGRFIATPNTPNAGKVGPAGLSFTLSDINVNAQVGTAPLGIREDTEKGGIREHAPIPLGKFPARLYGQPSECRSSHHQPRQEHDPLLERQSRRQLHLAIPKRQQREHAGDRFLPRIEFAGDNHLLSHRHSDSGRSRLLKFNGNEPLPYSEHRLPLSMPLRALSS